MTRPVLLFEGTRRDFESGLARDAAQHPTLHRVHSQEVILRRSASAGATRPPNMPSDVSKTPVKYASPIRSPTSPSFQAGYPSPGKVRPQSAKSRPQTAPAFSRGEPQGKGAVEGNPESSADTVEVKKTNLSQGAALPEGYKTTIPEKYHLWETIDNGRDQSGRILRRVFPSRYPSSRQEVELLKSCYHKMMEDIGDAVIDFEVAKNVYTSCIAEVARQVSIQCIERGMLLEELLTGLVGLCETKYEHITKLTREKLTGLKENENELQRLRLISSDERTAFSNKVEGLEREIKILNERHEMLKSDHEAVVLRDSELIHSLQNTISEFEAENGTMKKLLGNCVSVATMVSDSKVQKDLMGTPEEERWQKSIQRTSEYCRQGLQNERIIEQLESLNEDQRVELEALKRRLDAYANDELRPTEQIVHHPDTTAENITNVQLQDLENETFLANNESRINGSFGMSQDSPTTKSPDTSKEFTPSSGKELQKRASQPAFSRQSSAKQPIPSRQQSFTNQSSNGVASTSVSLRSSILKQNMTAKSQQNVAESIQPSSLSVSFFGSDGNTRDSNDWQIYYASFKLGFATAWPFEQVIQTIDQVYKDKIYNDANADRENRTRLCLQQFLYESFKFKYGIQYITEQHLSDFLEGIFEHHLSNIRIHLFARFLGFFSATSLNNMNLYLYTLNLLHQTKVGSPPTDTTTGVTVVSYVRVQNVLQELMYDRTPEERERVLKKLESFTEHIYWDAPTSKSAGISKSDNPTNSIHTVGDRELVLSVDRFLAIVLDESERENSLLDKYLSKLFSAGDVFGNGELDFPEYIAIVRFADYTCSTDRARQIFREYADPRTGRLAYAAYLRIARRFNYGCCWTPKLRVGGKNETVADYVRSLQDDVRKNSKSIAHEIKSMKGVNSHVAIRLYEKLSIRDEIARKLTDEKKDPQLAWIALRILLNEVEVCRQWRASLRQ